MKQQHPAVNEYGFVGVQYLVDKYRRTYEEILNLFIDCDYSLQQTVKLLDQSLQSDFAA